MYPFEAARPQSFWLFPIPDDVSYFLFLASTVGPTILLSCWYLPELFGLIVDWIRGRDLLAEAEADRRLDGRLIDPDFLVRASAGAKRSQRLDTK